MPILPIKNPDALVPIQIRNQLFLIMLLYNVTLTIDLDVHEDWLQWMKETHIPDVMATQMFLSYRLNKMIGHEHDDAEIYTVQYLVKDMLHLKHYNENFAPELQAKVKDRYDGKYVAFRTVMEIIDHNEKM